MQPSLFSNAPLPAAFLAEWHAIGGAPFVVVASVERGELWTICLHTNNKRVAVIARDDVRQAARDLHAQANRFIRRDMSSSRTQTEQSVITSPHGAGELRVFIKVRDCNYGVPIVGMQISDDDKMLLPSLLLTPTEAIALARFLKEAADRQSALDVVASSK
jgi:hypothetical protein